MSDLGIFWNLSKLRRNAWCKTSELKKMQQKKLRAIIKHAYENVRFYHKRFNMLKIRPEYIKTEEDLRKIPPTTRANVQENFSEMIANGVDINRCKKYRTSGSTGVPVTVISDRKAEEFRAALFGRPFFECGVGLRDKMLFMKVPDLDNNDAPWPSKRWYQRLGFIRRMYVSVYEPIENHLSSIEKFRPDAIYGYSSHIYFLAKAVLETEGNMISPKLIFGTAEPLTEKTRSFTNSTFGVEMFDLFGCVEVERTAWECAEHVGYHMDIDGVLTEFIRDGEAVGNGEKGEILYTCLYNYAMPLIRYSVGDVGVPMDESCPCGRGLPLMKNIEGRVDDFIRTPDGRIFNPISFQNILDHILGIAQYQVIQEKRDEIIVKLVKRSDFSEDAITWVKKELGKLVGEEVTINPVIVQEIPRSSGKFRAILSRICTESLFSEL